MLGIGIHTQERYMRMGSERRFAGPSVAYNLLLIGDNPSEEQIKVFEDISFKLRTSNGTFRTTFRNRFHDVDEGSIDVMKRFFTAESPIRVEDRAVSHGLTSCEWAKQLLPVFPAAEIEASDLLLQLLELSVDDGVTFITEVDGTPLQYIKPPFVVALHHPESWRNPLRRWVAARGRKRFDALGLPGDWFEQHAEHPRGTGYRVRPIPSIHPAAAALERSDPRFKFRRRSVFDRSPAPCHVLRTMNIFNRAYFSLERLEEGCRAVFDSLQPGGIWIVGRTLEEDPTNHATFFRKSEDGWEVLDRIGGGWELEKMALGLTR
jgi:hypothetical protein